MRLLAQERLNSFDKWGGGDVRFLETPCETPVFGEWNKVSLTVNDDLITAE
jgi:hypothetical protein